MIIAPSIFAADIAKLASEVKEVEAAGARYLHIDIMDGHFVPNLSFGPNIVSGLRAHSNMIFDVHLMVESPGKFIREFIDAGAGIITVHAEINEKIENLFHICQQRDVRFGLSVCPQTPIKNIIEYLPLLDLLLIMGIKPGYGGQRFMPKTIDRIIEAKQLRDNNDGCFLISVDGGVNENTACEIANAGADILVTGTSVFGKKDRKQAINTILEQVKQK